MLTQILNAQIRGHEDVSIPFSKIKLSITEILKAKNFISEVSLKKRKSKKSELEFIELKLRYTNGVPGILGFKIISRPSRRIYTNKRSLKTVKQGYGISVLSTPKGLLAGEEAKKAGVGGEMLFEIW